MNYLRPRRVWKRQALDEVKWEMLNEWAQTRRAPRHARWMHDGSFGAAGTMNGVLPAPTGEMKDGGL